MRRAHARVAAESPARDQAVPLLAAVGTPPLGLGLEPIRRACRTEAEVQIRRHKNIVRGRAERGHAASDERADLEAEWYVLQPTERVEATDAHESNAAHSQQRIHARGVRFHEAAGERARRIRLKSEVSDALCQRIRPGALVRDRDSIQRQATRRSESADAAELREFTGIAEGESAAVAQHESGVSAALADERTPRKPL